MRIGIEACVFALLMLSACDQGPKLKATFGIYVDLQGLLITNKLEILDQYPSVKPLPKRVYDVDPRGRAKHWAIRYNDTEHIALDVNFTTSGDMSVSGLLFDDCYDEFEKFRQRLTQELSTTFSNRVRSSESERTPMHSQRYYERYYE